MTSPQLDKIPHLLPRDYLLDLDGRLIFYSVKVQTSWEKGSFGPVDPDEDLIIVLHMEGIPFEDYERIFNRALDNGHTEQELLDCFYMFVDEECPDINYSIAQVDKEVTFYSCIPSKAGLFKELLPLLCDPYKYHWEEIRDRLITDILQGSINFDEEVYEVIDLISIIFARKWELGLGVCANDPDSNNFAYPRVDREEQLKRDVARAIESALRIIKKVWHEPEVEKLLKERKLQKEGFQSWNRIWELLQSLPAPKRDQYLGILFCALFDYIDPLELDLLEDIEKILSNDTERIVQICDRNRIYLPPKGTYRSYQQISDLYGEILAREIMGEAWKAYYGYDALLNDFRSALEKKKMEAGPTPVQALAYPSSQLGNLLLSHPDFFERLKSHEERYKQKASEIRMECARKYPYWTELDEVTRERIVLGLYYEQSSVGGDVEPTIMKLATAFENELTVKLLPEINRLNLKLLSQRGSLDHLTIEKFLAIVDKYGQEIFKITKDEWKQLKDQLYTLKDIRAYGPAHSIHGASPDGLIRFKSILLGGTKDNRPLLERILKWGKMLAP